ncbi:putative NADPH:quinone reductase [Paratrimastix pyriformis]|uniref:NADPH:quinone reductase n=1 Tax=Paratrimastix pyriformis TaxID=342808 RepID=A0ABQ8UHB7_9EUKA|nr:putative NADPH:quinone reductase [Paratrimastix pyriformis]
MAQNMRLLWLTEHKTLELAESPVPEPNVGEYLVRVSCTPVTMYDIMFIRGFYHGERKTPCVPGFECVGTVIREGGGRNKNVGVRVACLSLRNGTWAEYVVVPSSHCVILPPNIRDEQCAAPFLNPLTAMFMLGDAQRFGYPAVTVTAGYSALGKMLLRMAPRYKVKVISIVRLLRHADALNALGSPCALVLGDPEFESLFREAVREFNCHLAFDSIGGKLTGRILSLMPEGSTIQVYGAREDVNDCQVEVGSLIFKNQHLDGFWLVERLRTMRPKDVTKMLNQCKNYWTGALATDIRMIIPLEKFKENMEPYHEAVEHDTVILAPFRRLDRFKSITEDEEAAQRAAAERFVPEMPHPVASPIQPEEGGPSELEQKPLEQRPSGRSPTAPRLYAAAPPPPAVGQPQISHVEGFPHSPVEARPVQPLQPLEAIQQPGQPGVRPVPPVQPLQPQEPQPSEGPAMAAQREPSSSLVQPIPLAGPERPPEKLEPSRPSSVQPAAGIST